MTEKEIVAACLEYNIVNYIINDNGTIDVFGDVIFNRIDMTELPVIFRKVTGDFSCINNDMTSLKGCPLIVGGYFDCSFNKLTSLQYGPTIVYGDFYCSKNKLTSLEYSPYEVGGDFCCNSRDISFNSHSYFGITTNIKGKVHTDHNEEKTILELFRYDILPHQIDDGHVDIKLMYRQWVIDQIVEN